MKRCWYRSVAAVILLVSAVTAVHGAEALPEKYRSAVAAVEDGAQKARCVRAALAIEKWSKKLKLGNWDIRLVCTEPPRFPGAYGGSQTLSESLTAVVWVNLETDKDPEEIVIHELLHVMMRDVQTPMGEERAIWTLGDLLYRSVTGKHVEGP